MSSVPADLGSESDLPLTARASARTAADGARAAFESLFRAHFATVLRFAERRVDDREQAREIAMDSFEIAWRRFDPAAPFELPWLLRTARNRIGDAYRKRDRERAATAHLLEAGRHADGSDGFESAELAIAMAGLRPKEREVLALVYWDGLSAADAAKVLGCGEAAVWKRLSRARDALRSRLAAPAEPRQTESR
ncbi:sigma-70 family RNA polymerase sigma factor [Microbacterium sp. JZ37]|uniref:RNA polymerase sigma factor n=1 Tax=Microbacterium sp. JZ37 TaxID=2654193 RepID=UPI002B46D81F|nr:sigma-70 family RNA polymerase sigma factor [Microbacterium sp. JZ37]